MRIAIFAETFLPKVDGIATTTCRLLDYLGHNGHSSLMFAPEGAPETYAKTRIVGLPQFTFPPYPDLKLVRPVVNLMHHLRAFQPDIIHLINPALFGLTGLNHARQLNVPVVASYHTDIPGYASQYGVPVLEQPLWAYFRWIHNQADLNFCPSHFTQRQLVAHGFERMRVWSHGVETDRFSPAHYSQTWRMEMSGGHPEAPLMLYVGRLAPEKRIDWMLPVLEANPEARLCIVGDGPIRSDLEKQFAGSKTVFTGYLRGLSLSRAYASADLFAFPSDSETFGNVVLEAMAAGVPVVAPDKGGQTDLVKDGLNGFAFRSTSQQDFANVTTMLLQNKALCRRLGRQARTYAEQQSWDAVMDGLIQDYESAIQRGTLHVPPQVAFAQRRQGMLDRIRSQGGFWS